MTADDPSAPSGHRTSDGAIFHQLGCRSYTTTPLLSLESHCMGSLCIVGRQPRVMDVDECTFLNNMGELVARFLDPRLSDSSPAEGGSLSLVPMVRKWPSAQDRPGPGPAFQ